MNPVRMLLHSLRRALRIQRARAVPPRGPKPRVGRRAVFGDVRITIQPGLSDDLWEWLLDQGWREWSYRPDRRRYREISSSWVTRLIDCDPAKRAEVLKDGVANARHRPRMSDPEAMAVYIEIE